MPASVVVILFAGVFFLIALTLLVNPYFFFAIPVFSVVMMIIGLVKKWL